MPPGSVALAVSNIGDHSVPVATTAFAVGATLIHVPVANITDDSFPNASLTFARNHVDVGSFCIPNEYILFPVHPIHVLPLSVLKLYGVALNPTPASTGLVILKFNPDASVVDPLLNTKVGHCLSILIDHVLAVVSTFPTVSVLEYLIY